MIKAIINGQPKEFTEGISVLEALSSVGIEVPTLCHDERLKPIGSCRLCLVEVEGRPRPITACDNRLVDGMVISTPTAALENERRMLLRMLARNHPAAGLQKSPHKQFYRHALQYGLTEADFNGERDPVLLDDSHPYIHVDMSQCVTCYRCVRICEEVQGQFVWQVVNRGHDTRIVPDSGTTLLESSCVSCGACVDTCPSGALEDHSSLSHGTPTNWTRTTCPYCGTGCEMNVGTTAGRMVAALRGIAELVPLVVPLHPRGRATLEAAGLGADPRVLVIEPLGYVEFMSLVRGAAIVITDSGGIQEETTILGVPCLTLRPNTERPITISHGTNRLVEAETALAAAREVLSGVRTTPAEPPPLWDGAAGDRIAAIVERWLAAPTPVA